jgi:hypothetical protein
MKKSIPKLKVDLDLQDAKENAADINGVMKEQYDLLFSELTPIEKKAKAGKPLAWVEGIIIYPNGVTKS